MQFRSAGGRKGRFRRRRFKPKKNIFGGAWAVIYLVMGLASWLVWRQGGLWAQLIPLCLYLCQLGVNLFAWPPIFVGGHRRRYAVADSAGKAAAAGRCICRYCLSAVHPYLMYPQQVQRAVLLGAEQCHTSTMTFIAQQRMNPTALLII